ncbi:Zinc finger protein Dzip1, partial [Dissostichus eleginoides]
ALVILGKGPQAGPQTCSAARHHASLCGALTTALSKTLNQKGHSLHLVPDEKEACEDIGEEACDTICIFQQVPFQSKLLNEVSEAVMKQKRAHRKEPPYPRQMGKRSLWKFSGSFGSCCCSDWPGPGAQWEDERKSVRSSERGLRGDPPPRLRLSCQSQDLFAGIKISIHQDSTEAVWGLAEEMASPSSGTLTEVLSQHLRCPECESIFNFMLKKKHPKNNLGLVLEYKQQCMLSITAAVGSISSDTEGRQEGGTAITPPYNTSLQSSDQISTDLLGTLFNPDPLIPVFRLPVSPFQSPESASPFPPLSASCVKSTQHPQHHRKHNQSMMPFHDGAYYPFTGDIQGTHSSAGIPSLLNSPLSHPSVNGHSAPAPSMTPSSGASINLPFKFRPRRESVDWRRINAVDIDLVVSQLDVDALQEHISGVTFCSLDGERCQRCQSPVDPALIKLLRLAQLTVEWLLHCQEFLTLNLRAAEERLAAAARDREQLLAQQNKQEEKVKTLTTELKQRKKLIRNQQSLIPPRIISGQKCPHCDKSFLNSTFLQNHMQRRHPGEYETDLRSESEKKSLNESLRMEINSLKEQIDQQQQDLQAKIVQEKEQQSMQKELLRELERFKAEEMARMDRKIEDSRDGMRREMEFLYTRNIQALNEVNQNHTAKHEIPPSPVQLQPERDLDNYKEMQTQAIHKLEHQMKKQEKKWGSKLQEIKSLHESEKNKLLNELSRLQSSVSEQQESRQRLQQDLGRRLQDKEHTIKAQRDQIRNFSSNPPTKIVEVPVILSAPAPDPKPKRVVLEEPASAPKLDPIQELSEEEKDSSSFSEKRPVEKKSEPLPEKKQRVNISALKRNPNLKKEMRPELEQAVMEKLENLGVKPEQCGLKDKELSSILAKAHSKRESTAKGMPHYWGYREEINSTVEQRVARQRRGSDPAAVSQPRTRQPVQVVQIRPRSSSLPSRDTQVMSKPAVKQPKTPQPAPRTKTTTQPKTSTPNTKSTLKTFASKTPPFSSDAESEGEDTDMEEEPTSFSSNPPQTRGSGGGVTKTTVAKIESDEEDEWSDVSELQEIDPKRLQSFKDQNGNVEKRNVGKENKINDLARKMEKQFAERSLKKPAGGVSILPERKDEVQELTSAAPTRKSLDSPSTSVWGTSTGKAPKSGLTEAGTGSTLKSSLCSLSDISDSEDFSNKYK